MYSIAGESCIESLPIKQRRFLRSNDHLISRANSLKKAFQQLIIHAETGNFFCIHVTIYMIYIV